MRKDKKSQNGLNGMLMMGQALESSSNDEYLAGLSDFEGKYSQRSRENGFQELISPRKITFKQRVVGSLDGMNDEESANQELAEKIL